MPRLHFYLDVNPKRKKQLIFLHVRYAGKKLKYSTQEWAPNKNSWDSDNEQLYSDKKFPHLELINYKLANIKIIANKCYYDLFNELGREPEPNEYKSKLNELLNRVPKKKHKKIDLIDYIERYIDDRKNILSEGRLRHYIYTSNFLKELVNTKKNVSLELNSIDLSFYKEFIDFCVKNKKIVNKTTNLHLKKIKATLQDATEELGIEKVNQSFKSRKFKNLPEAKANVVHLTPEEIEMIINADLNENERLDKIRDAFIISYCTGFRYSELKKLTTINVRDVGNDKKMIKIFAPKPKKWVNVPYHYYLETILSKRNGKLPKIPSDQNMRKYLKELCSLVGITGKITLVKLIGNEEIKEVVDRVSKIGTHTARRSFIRNAYCSDLNIDLEDIRLAVGHSNIEQTREYARLDEIDNVQKLAISNFYKKI